MMIGPIIVESIFKVENQRREQQVATAIQINQAERYRTTHQRRVLLNPVKAVMRLIARLRSSLPGRSPSQEESRVPELVKKYDKPSTQTQPFE
jgi:uncharacterized heparinase superfamily protein